MSTLSFHHPNIEIVNNRARYSANSNTSLIVSTGADEISWGYELNTANFATYEGEVVQILSCYIDDLSISGTCRNYRQMEKIYNYFVFYLHLATQGQNISRRTGETRYNQKPITMKYPMRGWEFKIQPTQVPGFRYGRDVVAPQWRIVAHVVDKSSEVTDITVAEILNGDEFDTEGRIGFDLNNPFQDPYGDFKLHNKKAREILAPYGDYFNQIIADYVEGDFGIITGESGSRPSGKNRSTSEEGATTYDKGDQPG